MKLKTGFTTAGQGCFFVNPDITTEDILSYVDKRLWHIVDHPNKKIVVLKGPSDDDGRPVKIVLPADKSLTDYQDRINQAIDILATTKATPPQNICSGIKSQRFDILRQRIYGDSRRDSIPLEFAPKLVGSLRNLVYYSACAEEDPQPYFYKGRNVGRDYTKKCRFGHTFHGSFGLSLEMPIPPREINYLDDSFAQSPFERRVIERIIFGMNSIQQGVQEGNLELLTKNFEKGFNANIFDVLIEMSTLLSDCFFDFSIQWSPNYPVADLLRNIEPIKFDPQLVTPYLESAAKSLRKAKESEETEVQGIITQLKATALEDEDPALFEEPKEVTILWEVDSGKRVLIKVHLSVDEYKLACDAHRDSRQVSVIGRPEKHGKSFRLTAAKKFHILS